MGRIRTEAAEPYEAIRGLYKDGLGAIIKTVRIIKFIQFRLFISNLIGTDEDTAAARQGPTRHSLLQVQQVSLDLS
jgi:hypothetical protein